MGIPSLQERRIPKRAYYIPNLERAKIQQVGHKIKQKPILLKCRIKIRSNPGTMACVHKSCPHSHYNELKQQRPLLL